MYQFFIESGQARDGKVWITGDDAHHIRHVLRMKAGEKLRVSDENQTSYFCHVTELTENAVCAEIDETDTAGTELSCRIRLYQGLPKGDKLEQIIQKAVELGACEIVPVAMKNCVVRLDEKKAQQKLRRWQAIAESAAKQAKRTYLPRVRLPIPWAEAIAEAYAQHGAVLVPYENARGMEATRQALRGIADGASVAVCIGPEGGFAPEEIEAVRPSDRLSLGRRILRTETAGSAILAMLVYELEK